MKQISICTFVALAISLATCSKEYEPHPQRLVVEAFLFTGLPSTDISVKQMKSIEGDGAEQFLPGANVTLTRATNVFPLTFNPSTSRYEYEGGAPLSVSSGDTFKIQVTLGEQSANAVTIVPQAPTGIQISSSTIRIPQINYDFSLADQVRDLFETARLGLTWDNPDNGIYFVVIESRATSIDPILPSQLPQQLKDLLSTFRFISSPTNIPTFEIVGVALETYGRHVAKVYRVNPEYDALFNNPPQDSRDLNEPPTNITNGVGIFSAFASDSVFFEVTR